MKILLSIFLVALSASGQSFFIGAPSVVIDPIITSNPSDSSVNVGQNATFNVTASGTATIHYTWKFNGSTVGSDQNSYTRVNCQLADNGGQVKCVVNNSIGTVTSGTATLTVTAGSWDPTQEASLRAWYDASSNTNLTNSVPANPSSGNQVAFWRDSSGNGFVATGAGSPNPTWIGNVQNGLGVTRFAGIDENFVASALGPVFAANDGQITFAAVMKFSDTGTGRSTWTFWGNSAQQMNFGKIAGDQYDYFRFDGSTLKRDSAGSTDTSFHTLIGICTGTTVTLYMDGTQIGAANVDVDVTALDQLNNFGIGRNVGGGGLMVGDIGELQFYNSTSPTLTHIQTYLKAKWNTP